MKHSPEADVFVLTEQQQADTRLPREIALAETAGALAVVLTQIEECDGVIADAWLQRPAPRLDVISTAEDRQGRLAVLREELIDPAAPAFADVVEAYLAQQA